VNYCRRLIIASLQYAALIWFGVLWRLHSTTQKTLQVLLGEREDGAVPAALVEELNNTNHDSVHDCLRSSCKVNWNSSEWFSQAQLLGRELVPGGNSWIV